MLLYIHGLNQLSSKSAELESVYLMRELKQKTSYPLRNDALNNMFVPFFASQTDLDLMQQTLELIPITVEAVQRLIQEQNQVHEAINLQRTVNILNEMVEPLKANLEFAGQMFQNQDSLVANLTGMLNSIPKLKTMDEKMGVNNQLKQVFYFLLRNKDFCFNYVDVVSEAQLNHIMDLMESLNKGYLFHFSLEDELKKRSFDSLKSSLSVDKLQEAEGIAMNVLLIKKGVERAYNFNWSIINMSVIIYSFIKWFNSNL